MDGNWYEIGDQYVQASRHEIARLFPCQPSLDLPPWYLASGRNEGDYNAHVKKVVFAILMQNGKELAADTPFTRSHRSRWHTLPGSSAPMTSRLR
jgi:hypothetical protein